MQSNESEVTNEGGMIAKCYLKAEPDSKHMVHFSPYWLTIAYGRHTWRFENENVTKVDLTHHKLLIPFIVGGLCSSFSLLFIFRNLFDPYFMLLILLAGLFMLYIGWLGKSGMVIWEGKACTKIYISSVSQNLRDFFLFYHDYRSQPAQPTTIYHIADKNSWDDSSDYYTHSSLQSEGFIHASKKSQVIPTFQEHFPSSGNYMLIEIDSLKLDCELKYEYIKARRESFPHIYGRVIKSAVVSTVSFSDVEELSSRVNL